jgi:signal transduction histidine kinase
MPLTLTDAVSVKGFTRQQDVILAELMDLVTRNVSREELLESFISKFKAYSTCTSIFVIEALPPVRSDGSQEWGLNGLCQAGIQLTRWQNYCSFLSEIKGRKHWILSLVSERKDEVLISRVWTSENINREIFDDIRRIINIDKSSWASILFLPTPSALYPSRLIVVTYEAGQTGEDAPRGGEQDWRILMLFRQIYDLSLFELRREAKRIIDHRKELLRDLAPSIIHHEINARVVNSKRALDLLLAVINKLPEGLNVSLHELSEALYKDITFLQRITHAMMGLDRRAKIEKYFLKNEIELLRDLTIFRLNKIGGLLKIDCPSDLMIATDSALLLHILVNLVNNAVDAMTLLKEKDFHFKPSLNIEAYVHTGEGLMKEDKPGIAIMISDNGIGIAPEIAVRIFEIGYTTKRGGHGLGLPISRLIAGFLGGNLDIVERPGQKGTIFKLWLPFTAPATEDLQRELEATLNEKKNK